MGNKSTSTWLPQDKCEVFTPHKLWKDGTVIKSTASKVFVQLAESHEILVIKRQDWGHISKPGVHLGQKLPFIRAEEIATEEQIDVLLTEDEQSLIQDHNDEHFVDILDQSGALESFDPFRQVFLAEGVVPPVPEGGWKWRPAMRNLKNESNGFNVSFLDGDHETLEIPLDRLDTVVAPYQTKSSCHIVHHSYQLGDVLDVLDEFKKKNSKDMGSKWRKCQVVKVQGPYYIRVTFVGWSRAYDQWFHVLQQNSRLAEFLQHTEKELIRKVNVDDVFLRCLRKNRDLTVIPVEPDGNCLFRAVAHQVYGKQDMHEMVRSDCCDYMEAHKERFAPLLENNFDKYLKHKRELKVWGDDPELRAMEELYDRPLEVYAARGDGTSTDPLVLHFKGDLPDEEISPIRLSFHGDNHYNSVIPFKTEGKHKIDVSLDQFELPVFRNTTRIRNHRRHSRKKSKDFRMSQQL